MRKFALLHKRYHNGIFTVLGLVMATSITLKNIPDHVYASLRAAANAHHRSLNGEIIACLEQSLLPTKNNVQEHLAKAREIRRALAPLTFSVDDITEAIKQGRA